MSWAEIKKAVNSNLDVPLNSLIDTDFANVKSIASDKYRSPMQIVYGAKTGDCPSYTTIAEVTGKGLLYLASIEEVRRYNGKTGYTIFSLEVDNQVVSTQVGEDTVNPAGTLVAGIFHDSFIKVTGTAVNTAIYPVLCYARANQSSGSVGGVSFSYPYLDYPATRTFRLFKLGSNIENKTSSTSPTVIDVFADIINEPILFNSKVRVRVMESTTYDPTRRATIVYVPLP